MAGGRRGGATLLGLVAVLIGLAALLGLAPSAALAKDGQVTVRAAGATGAAVTVRLADLGGTDINRIYTLGAGPTQISGHSLSKVMSEADAESAEIDLATIPAIEIDRPKGAPITVTGAEIRNPSAAFPQGPPVFYEDNGATVFVMPGRGSANASRFRFESAPVGITVQAGVTYDVALSASRTKIKVGQTIRFTATVAGQDEGERLTYSWNFGDGKTATTRRGTTSHTFRTDGNSSVVLGVVGSSGSGQSGILIEVGEVKQKPDPKPDPPEDKPSDDPGPGGSGNPSGGGGVGTGSGGGTGDFGSGDGSPSTPAPAPPVDRRQDRNAPDDGLTTVTGELVDPATTSVPFEPSTGLPVDSADPATPGTQQGGFGVPGAVMTLVGVGLLLGLGGFAELRIFSRLY